MSRWVDFLQGVLAGVGIAGTEWEHQGACMTIHLELTSDDNEEF